MDRNDIWGWVAPIIVWCGDHYSGIFAFVLFIAQLVYQTIRIQRLYKNKRISDVSE